MPAPNRLSSSSPYWARSAASNVARVLATDVVVVGGGPAGAAAAITLARAGRDVVVIDKARFPRDKCCGDGLTAEALRLLQHLGLDPSAVSSWQTVDDVVVRSPSGRTTVFPLPRHEGLFAAVARRTDLDSALLDVARAAGAKVLDGHALLSARQQHDRVIAEVAGLGDVHARYAIGADGAWSPLRKALGAAVPVYLGEPDPGLVEAGDHLAPEELDRLHGRLIRHRRRQRANIRRAFAGVAQW